ncbi:kinase-like domain-containing protein [Lasiosphaeria ovina]|uniref:Kinase-like domain-containing protein n=1 Tax=Lasiosphaeria ovina TaxID=92902 RepID=A0AAE0KFS6_9PEZI|nr:kinase-like domain-containing protein [Lasiosphaeria ovina]
MAPFKKLAVSKLAYEVYSEVSTDPRTSEVVTSDQIIFYSRDEDDRLRLGAAYFKDLPDKVFQGVPPGPHRTFKQLKGVLRAEVIKHRLRDIPDAHIYPELPFTFPVMVAGEPPGFPSDQLYVKYVATPLVMGRDLEDNTPLLLIAQHRPPHPNIVGYHGVRERRGFTTAVVLDCAPGPSLWEHVYQHGRDLADKRAFMAALLSAVAHLHGVIGVAHNDISPSSVLLGADQRPLLVDFGSCRPLGKKIGPSTVMSEWERDAGKGSGYDVSKVRESQ